MLELHRTLSNNETSLEIQSCFFFLQSCFLNLNFFPLRSDGFELKKANTFQHVASLSHDTLKAHFNFYCCFFTQPRAYKDLMILLCLCNWVKSIETACRRNRQ